LTFRSFIRVPFGNSIAKSFVDIDLPLSLRLQETAEKIGKTSSTATLQYIAQSKIPSSDADLRERVLRKSQLDALSSLNPSTLHHAIVLLEFEKVFKKEEGPDVQWNWANYSWIEKLDEETLRQVRLLGVVVMFGGILFKLKRAFCYIYQLGH
jgi:hypothetical protein